jgi:hypothetical protein
MIYAASHVFSRAAVFFKSGCQEGKMGGCNTEPGLSDALADPIVQSLMSADHVDPHALAESLRETARKFSPALRQCPANEK